MRPQILATDPDFMRTIVYADGGCDPNPGPGGWGAVIQDPAGTVELHGGERGTTNNRMELTAAIRALEHFPEGAQVEMRCDSQYVVKSVTEWMRGWKARGWRTATGPVKNIDLMQRLDALNAARDVRWTWVRGHAGEAGNERADRLATLGRREALGQPALREIAPLPGEAPPAAASKEAPAVAPATAPAAASKEGPATTLAVSPDLANAAARAARRAGVTPQAYAEDALRLALELGPGGVARARAALQKAS